CKAGNRRIVDTDPGRFRWRLSGRRLGFQTENDRRPGQSGTSQKLSSAPSVFSLARHGAPPLEVNPDSDGRGRLIRLKADKRSKSTMDSIPPIPRAPAAARAPRAATLRLRCRAA